LDRSHRRAQADRGQLERPPGIAQLHLGKPFTLHRPKRLFDAPAQPIKAHQFSGLRDTGREWPMATCLRNDLRLRSLRVMCESRSSVEEGFCGSGHSPAMWVEALDKADVAFLEQLHPGRQRQVAAAALAGDDDAATVNA
jgi:hypothetical protein